MIVLPDGTKFEPKARPPEGSCPDCGAAQTRFARALGGTEVCLDCGHERKAK